LRCPGSGRILLFMFDTTSAAYVAPSANHEPGVENEAAMPTPVESPDSRTFQVLLSRKAGVEAGLTQLTKRAIKKSLPTLTWAWGKAYTQREHTGEGPCSQANHCEGCQNVGRVPLTLVGETPRFQGWTFLAALEHMDGENVVRAVPGHDVPVAYRTRGPVCDHCHAARRRNETYVLHHATKGHTQVGSTCIGDFLGSDDAGKLAASATYVAAMRALAEEGLKGSGASSNDLTLGAYLPMVAWCVREQGWVSRTAAREQGGNATANRALTYLFDKKLAKEASAAPTEEDTAMGTAAALWAETLTDAEVNAENGDYLHNLRVIARNAIVSYKSAGLAGSMVVAHQRTMGRAKARTERAARKPSEFVGTVKTRQAFGAVTLDFVTGYQTAFGYTTVLKFLTDEGNVLTWKATSTDIARQDVGKKYDLTGTVKKHEEYKGQKQTILNRCKLVDLTPVADKASEDAS
jgi:hypothetical protein